MGLFRNYLQKFNSARDQAPTPLNDQSLQQSSDDSEYTFDVVGESFQRDHLVQLIKNNDSVTNGELYTTATLKLEPENPFDSTAVMVIIQDLQVGYIPKSFSGEITDYIKAKGGKTLQVPARIGWDVDSPQPLVGVRLKMEDF